MASNLVLTAVSLWCGFLITDVINVVIATRTARSTASTATFHGAATVNFLNQSFQTARCPSLVWKHFHQSRCTILVAFFQNFNCVLIFNRKWHYYFVVCKLVNNTSHWRHHWQRIYNVNTTETVVDCWKLLFHQLVKSWCQKSTTCMEKYVMYGDKTCAISFTR